MSTKCDPDSRSVATSVPRPNPPRRKKVPSTKARVGRSSHAVCRRHSSPTATAGRRRSDGIIVGLSERPYPRLANACYYCSCGENLAAFVHALVIHACSAEGWRDVARTIVVGIALSPQYKAALRVHMGVRIHTHARKHTARKPTARKRELENEGIRD